MLLIGAAALLGAPSYAETHFNIAPWASRLYRREPEIYWDCPWRFTRGRPLPMAVIVKDARQFPAVLHEPVIEAECGGKTYRLNIRSKKTFPVKVDEPFFYAVVEVDFPEEAAGSVLVSPKMRVQIGSKERTVGVSSHPAFSTEPLRVYAAQNDLPRLPGWTYAETHTHSWHTSDQIEFGAPPELLSRFGAAVGLEWVFVTDHSFDLVTPVGRWSGVDPDGGRWKQLGSEIEAVNESNAGARLIRGEEVSCGSADQKNLHLLVYGSSELIPGSGDAGKQWKLWRNNPDITLEQALKTARQNDAAAFAAHPMHHISLGERIALNRSSWGESDLAQALDGIEVWNRNIAERMKGSRARWIQMLLNGYRKPGIAGSDAHGDFNRSRRIKAPFVSVKEDFNEGFGRPRTALYAPGGTRAELFNALKTGKAVMTNGPFVHFEIEADGAKRVGIGETTRGRNIAAQIHAVSTEEFGAARRTSLMIGRIGAEEERSIVLGEHVGYERKFNARLALDADSYLRVECETERGLAMTNPIWIDAPES